MNMLGQHLPVDNVPFFWTRFFNSSVQYTGNTASWDEVIIKGNVQDLKFVAYYVNKGKIVAAAAMNSLNSIMIVKEAMQQGVMPTAEEVKKGDWKVEGLVEEIKKKGPACKKCGVIRG